MCKRRLRATHLLGRCRGHCSGCPSHRQPRTASRASSRAAPPREGTWPSANRVCQVPHGWQNSRQCSRPSFLGHHSRLCHKHRHSLLRGRGWHGRHGRHGQHGRCRRRHVRCSQPPGPLPLLAPDRHCHSRLSRRLSANPAWAPTNRWLPKWTRPPAHLADQPVAQPAAATNRSSLTTSPSSRRSTCHPHC